MKLEHFALNVENPIAMADWYVTNLGTPGGQANGRSAFYHFFSG